MKFPALYNNVKSNDYGEIPSVTISPQTLCTYNGADTGQCLAIRQGLCKKKEGNWAFEEWEKHTLQFWRDSPYF